MRKLQRNPIRYQPVFTHCLKGEAAVMSKRIENLRSIEQKPDPRPPTPVLLSPTSDPRSLFHHPLILSSQNGPCQNGTEAVAI